MTQTSLRLDALVSATTAVRTVSNVLLNVMTTYGRLCIPYMAATAVGDRAH